MWFYCHYQRPEVLINGLSRHGFNRAEPCGGIYKPTANWNCEFHGKPGQVAVATTVHSPGGNDV